MYKVGILAGEASGDRLGAGLMAALKSHIPSPVNPDPQMEFYGVGGPAMQAQGLQSLSAFEALSVNGFVDPLLKLPQLYKLLTSLERRLLELKIDVFIGVDFNVFNFMLEKRLKKKGVKTVHYVSPSVYAWRTGRTKKIAASADLLLCLFPFEPAFYEQTDIHAKFVGHPLADEITLEASNEEAKKGARETLEISSEDVVLAILPGSRSGEVNLLLDDFLAAAQLFAQNRQADDPKKVVHVVIPCVRANIRSIVEQKLKNLPNTKNLQFIAYDGTARQGLVACDIALVKSGTSTLETMLLHRPMVVSYRLGRLSYQIARRVLRTPYVALPNILSGKEWVPELLQQQATPINLATHLLEQLQSFQSSTAKRQHFLDLHQQLRCNADAQAAAAVVGLLS